MMRKYCIIVIIISTSLMSFAQYGYESHHDITFQFLEITPHARIGGFGEVDAVGSSFYHDGGLFQNPALLSRQTKSVGASFSYSPYLRKQISDLNLMNLNGFYVFDSNNAVGLNLVIFDKGELTLTDEFGSYLGHERFYDLFIQATYSHSFNKQISAGVSAKYIKSKTSVIFDGYNDNTNSFAVNLGFSFDDQYTLSETSYLNTSFGISISNFGPKVSNDNTIEDKFLPTKLLVGLFINPDLYLNDKLRFNIELGYQAEKYLVPTPQPQINDSLYLSNQYADISSFQALYESFYDAPGGFSEELDEIMHKFGSEFRLTFSNSLYFALRHGRFLENETKGNRKYQTFGLGGGYRGFKVDLKIIGFAEYEPLNGNWMISFGYTKPLNQLKQ